MNISKLFRCFLLFYESIRFIFVIRDIRGFSLMNDLSFMDSLQALVWFAPNALFPLMALFVLIAPDAYKPYVPLYLAGKCVTCALTVRLFIAFAFNPFGSGAMSPLFLVFLMIGDGMCVIICALILIHARRLPK